MTNKMPVVGKRYLSTTTGWECELKRFNEKTATAYDKYGTRLECVATRFWDYFEEPPEDNLQETEEVQINEKGEVSEIDKALDELKEAISKSLGKITCVNDVNKITSKLMDVAQNLINTLEAEKKPFFKIREEGHFEGSPPTKQTDAKIEEFIKDYKRNNRENTSKEKPKIDMKEECVEPVSIWKDVSELPRCLDGAAVFYKRDGQTFIGEAHSFGVIAIYPDSNSEHLNNEDIDKVCLVGDFINSFEQMQKERK